MKMKSLQIFFLDLNAVAQCLCAELEMWIFLKEEKPDEAWTGLSAAQMAAVDSVRAHRTFAHKKLRRHGWKR